MAGLSAWLVRRIQRGLRAVGVGRTKGVGRPRCVGVRVVVAAARNAVVAPADDVARGTGDDADPVVARSEFYRGGEGEFIPARRVRAFEGQLLGYAQQRARFAACIGVQQALQHLLSRNSARLEVDAQL